MNTKEFENDLKDLVNRHSLEGMSDTADYVLARFLGDCLDAFTTAVNSRGLLVNESDLLPSEALFGFAAWASSLNPNNHWDDCALWAELVDKFCKENSLAPPRDNQPDFVMPPKERDKCSEPQ